LGEPSFSGELFDNHVYAMIADIKSGIMATRNPDNNQNSPEIENNLREKRQSAGMSQKQLADMAGITRQAVSAVEANHYSPATSVALQLARALHCRVEDLFTIKSGGEIIEGELIGSLPRGDDKLRAHVTRVGERLLVRPLDGFGELASLSATADGLILGGGSDAKHVKVQLFEHRERLGRKVVVAGCDPAMFLAAEHVRRRDKYNLVPCLMGSGMAIGALKRGEVHVAGVHLADNRSGTWNLPYLERNLTGMDCFVVTFAHWEEGLILRQGNPKKIRSVADLARSGVRIVNREIGSGARRLLDGQLETCGIQTDRIKGYKDEVPSHLEVASRVRAGLADTGIGVRAAASICGLDFVPLQRERYDLVIPKRHYETLQGLKILLDTIVTRPFRAELEALGGYDTRETGAMRNLKVA
jgi:molybdate-binding protein/DNA-binding XRE family transcriptional regulator